jgi:hypothetical protein
MVRHHGTEGPGDLFDLSFKSLDSLQQRRKNMGMMVGEKALDGAMKLLGLPLERTTGALLDFVEANSRFAADEEFHEASPRGAEKIRYDGVNFDIGALKGFMDTSSEIANCSHVTLAHCPKLAPLAAIVRQDKASLEQTVSKQTSQPLGVCDVGFASRNILNMTRVDQNDLHMSLKDVVDWAPVDTCTLDGGNGAAMSTKPVPQTVKVVGVSSKFFNLTECMSAFVGTEKTSRNMVLVHVKSAASGVDNGKNLAILSLGHGYSPNSLRVFPKKPVSMVDR